MRVTFAMPTTGLGYFPGLAKPVQIDTDQLPEAEARELAKLIEAARFFERPAEPDPAAGRQGADQRHYAITIEQGARRRELQVGEPIDDPELRSLVRLLEVQAKAQRARSRGQPNP